MAEGSISTFDFHVQHYGLSGRWVSWEGRVVQGMGLGESDSWPKVIILLVCQIHFLKYIWSFSFVLTDFFFFCDNTTHPEVSYRENEYVERISVIDVELSYINKDMSVWNDIPWVHPHSARVIPEIQTEWKETALHSANMTPASEDLNCSSLSAFFLIKQTISGFPF